MGQTGTALRACAKILRITGAGRSALIGVGAASAVINVLYLSGSLFMLQVYDRVLPSRSVPTLVALTLIVALAYCFQAAFELIRGRILVRAAAAIDAALSPRVCEIIAKLPLVAPRSGDGQQPIRDLDQVRSFIAGGAPQALLDLPWLPFYLMICFVFHVWIGVAATVGALLLVAIPFATEALTRDATRESARHLATRSELSEAARRNAEVLRAMGMTGRLQQRWAAVNWNFVNAHSQASDAAASMGAVSKFCRMMLQSAILAVGAYLVIQQEATGGIIIASSILSSRALAPVESAVAHWRSFVAARQSWERLDELFRSVPEEPRRLALPRPRRVLALENVAIAAPGDAGLIASGLTFRLEAGEGLGIIGPSGSGKTSLARALVGVWQPRAGKVRLDGAALDQWSSDALGRHIGYVPQDVELFSGTVRDNIARFDENADPEMVIRAAVAADVHELILSLPEGYETEIGERGRRLSAGQRQRVGLARALFGEPTLVVLDEPNSNLDAEGEAALTGAISSVRARGGIAVVIAHRPSALAAVDTVMMMAHGQIQAFGPKDEVLGRVLQLPPATVRELPRKLASIAS